MSAEEKQIQIIDNYLNSELSAEEMYLFEKKLNQDKAFAEEVQIQQNILSGIRQSGRREIKARFAALESRQFKPASTNPIFGNTRLMLPSWWPTGVAACLLLAAIAYMWVLQQPRQLFAQYYTSYPNVIESIERGTAPTDTRSQAMQAYEYGNYPLAIQRLEEILASQPQDVALAFYLGVAYLEDNQLEKAIKQLENAALQPSHEFSSQAMWYLSLAYIKNDDSRQAIPLLETLMRKNGEYSKRAERLLKEF